MTRVLLASSALLSVLVATAVLAQGNERIVNEGTPKPDCTARVNFDRNADMPGYAAERNGRRVCHAF
jgi:hypothetical protein